ncbi:histone deacetylase family protein [Marivivens donghaensis]|uniref:Histone deacetylase family protein n=1 Tax=Marivivens donghaensis TaxID=1699413 RepID=A0ABX0VUF2_9RHOB|nr:histone deacetylase family protein [Marivivens donghaensis]NIY71531.1 histone deacetylase family protein [Marivivens donghaensis]
MTTALLTHPDCLEHVTPSGHPEQVARLTYVLDAIKDIDLKQYKAPLAAEDDLLRCHPQGYIDEIRAKEPTVGFRQLDEDTHMSFGSVNAAWRAAGGAVKAVDLVLGGEVKNAFVATRPPGHHALADAPMGFCLFGNVSIAAKHALDFHGLDRVAIVDFDVHHGNGTQALCENDPRILVVTSQQVPLWPGSGEPSDRGQAGNIVNIAFPPQASSDQFRKVYEEQVFPQLEAFNPQLLLISAGFDAHKDDPLAELAFETEDYTWVTERLVDVADKCCQGRVVSVLEGGYNLDALAVSAAAHVKVLEERGR